MSLRQIEYALGTVAVVAILGIIAWVAFTVGTGGAIVDLRTTPPRATAYVDGHFIGTTPVVEKHLAPGKHVLRVTKFGHVSLVREIDLHTGRNTLKFDLTERPGGILDVSTTPSGAEIFVDGEPGGHTPKTIKELSTGGHHVRLTLVNYLDWMKTVNIEEDKTVKLDVKLKTRTEAVYLEAIKASPKDVILHTDLAHYYITRSEWKKAEDAFTTALLLTATVSRSAQYSGKLKREIGNVFSAQFQYADLNRGREVIVNALTRAVKAAPTYLKHYGPAVNYSIQIQRYDKAQEILETGILTFPYNQSWPLTALREQFKGNSDRLLRTLEARIRKSPDDFVSRFQRTALLRQKGKTDEIIGEYPHLIRLAKSTKVKGKLLVELGRLWERKRNYEKAVAAYRRALKTETSKKDAAPIQYNLVRALSRLTNHDRTFAAWKKAVELQENVEVACRWRLEWAKFCIRTKKNKKARAILDEALKLSQDTKTRSLVGELKKTIK